jgi:hypothetical protein
MNYHLQVYVRHVKNFHSFIVDAFEKTKDKNKSC